MPDPTLAAQKAIRARLIATAAVTALVPAVSIIDSNQRPAPSPSIMLGQDQAVDSAVLLDRSLVEVFSTLHVWKKEPSLAGVKTIAGAIRDAIGRNQRLAVDGHACCDLRFESARFMRDPDGETSHGVVVIYALLRVS